MLAVQLLSGTDFANAFVETVPPVVAAFLHGDGAAGALMDDDVADGGAIGERFIHRVLEADFLAAPPQVITTWASKSCMRALRASAEKPPNTTLWVMPSRAQASRATGSSGTMPM